MSSTDPEQPDPYGAQPPAPNPYAGQPPYGQQQPPYDPYQATRQQQAYGYGFSPAPPAHGSATTAMVLGLIGLIGILFCGGITLILSPFAWAIGGKAVREIDANPGVYSGREQAFAGKVMGIIGTILLILGVIVLAAFIAWLVTLDGSSPD
jgi:hypothetical protein